MSGRKIIAACNHAKHPRRIFGRIGGSVEGAVISSGRHVQRRDASVGCRADLHVHMVVARKARARQVLSSGLDPLDGTSQLERADDRTDIARVHRHLVAEAAADVGRNYVNLVFGDSSDDASRRAIHVRRLRCHIELQTPHRSKCATHPHVSSGAGWQRWNQIRCLIRFGLAASARAVPSLSPTSQ